MQSRVMLEKPKRLINNSNQAYFTAAGAFALVAVCLVFYQVNGFAIPCLWHYITGWHCPGCGATRMLIALLHGDFYQALHYNALLLVLLPFGILLFGDAIYHRIKGGKNVLDRIPEWAWVVLVIVMLIYAVMRNLEAFSFLAPTEL